MNLYPYSLRRLIVAILCSCTLLTQSAVSSSNDYYISPEITNPQETTAETIESTRPIETEPTIVEPTETEPTPTEPNDPIPTEPEPTKPTTPIETEPSVKYYDVPLDNDLQDYIFELCDRYDIDPALIIAMIRLESYFDPGEIGDKGNSLGLMQIQPRWHHERMDKLGCPDLLDPYQNVTVGIDLLSDYFAKGKPVEWVLMAYNGGASYANKKWQTGEISSYASTVLKYMDDLEYKEN